MGEPTSGSSPQTSASSEPRKRKTMALTPDDVVTKQFQHVRFKEGFDPDEVDDFLDEIVVEWRKTIAENDELKAKVSSLESGGATAAPAEEAPAPAAEAPAPA